MISMPVMADAGGTTSELALERIVGVSGGSVEQRLGEPLRSYWLDRVAQHTHDSYAGVPLAKFPEDLRVYEHLLWADRPDVVIELGTHCGGSALWFRDRLRTLATYGLIARARVITVDHEPERARPHLERADPHWQDDISLVAGDVCDESLPARIAALVPEGARCFVVEDSAHIHATTMAALSGFASFVPAGGFFIVEDGCVDVESMRLEPGWPRGVLSAVSEWLAGEAGLAFVIRRDLELYGVTCHPSGVLQRLHSTAPSG
jgi:cephalosporin hydroxylase